MPTFDAREIRRVGGQLAGDGAPAIDVLARSDFAAVDGYPALPPLAGLPVQADDTVSTGAARG